MFTSVVVLGALGINLVGSRIVDRAQTAIVILVLAVFAVFIAVTITSVDWGLLAFSKYPPLSDIVASVALTFFAFLGFSVITFAAGDLEDPARGLPRAMYTALGITGTPVHPHLHRRLRDAPGQRRRPVRRDRDRRGGAARRSATPGSR